MKEIPLLIYIENKVKEIDLEVERLTELGNKGIDVTNDLMELYAQLDAYEALVNTMRK
ncbi:hypothetical protein G166_gp66 [Clostridium phage phi8074-B1]|uniref:hypothetical protein n=1 Tax=Clostridium phage phi8074-B1 TaxID=1147137 RepID=UPI00025C0C75|nr:hypothetical protein G166_gp66 [Clostridium phage phi8074-B1]AFC61998.1 hypothetical protein phi8074-B1_00066 [Clostridium phage phi8074-B1]